MSIRIKYASNAVSVMAVLAVFSGLALNAIRSDGQMPFLSSQSPSQRDASQQAQGKQETWTGEITTAMCKGTRSSMGHDCILNCVKAGEKLVLLTKGRVEDISNQDFSDLKEHAGHHVKLTGYLAPDGKSITVTRIEMTNTASSSHP
ncbi:hypothetical protein [Tunturiibacter gelidiferens]|uniref:DUF5666 domain-containing protein n=1 Tax=Tunturiibacter gelidiferens TaxID=3069689 RepID=A0AAU7YUC6_9BACT